MGYFTEINEEGIITRVIVTEQESINSGAVYNPTN